MRKVIAIMLCLVLALSLFAACGEPKQEEFAGITLKMSIPDADNTDVAKGYKAACEAIKEKSNGKVDITVYANAILADQKTAALGVMDGSIDMASIGTSWMSEYTKSLSFANAPYMFESPDHMMKVLNSDFVATMLDEFTTKTDVKVIDFWYLGLRNTSSNKAATTPEEFAKIKLRAPTAQVYLDACEVLGVNATPLALGEVYLALQTGTVDGQENPFTVIDSRKFYEVQKYLIITEHMYDNVSPVINQETWNKIPAEYQEIITAAFKEQGELLMKKTVDGDAALREKFVAAGMEVIEPDLKIFRDRAVSMVYGKYADVWGKDTVSKVKALA